MNNFLIKIFQLQLQLIMMRKCLTNLVQRISTPVVKKDYHFTELELKALLQ